MKPPRQSPRLGDLLAFLVLAMLSLPMIWPDRSVLPNSLIAQLLALLPFLSLVLVVLQGLIPALRPLLAFGYSGARWATLAGFSLALASLSPVARATYLSQISLTSILMALPILVTTLALIYALLALLLDKELGCTSRRRKWRQTLNTMQ